MGAKIEVTIDKKGKASVHVKGIKGKKCLDITKILDEALGTPTLRNFTPEYAEAEQKDKAGAR